ncbi:helix-turn-helix domain-containing protein [Piscinibacter aquaticus]|uniref:Helix-turn-helix domain-containing protein n=1 Tax=Piscinibacter aquaticus TaxID=392597 RepID=A0A5C6TNT5_9BURK|nr:helix-turn-helix domain-containing protein [Piscinibacter aquaticus]
MNSHKHARLTAKGRALLVSRVLNEGWTMSAASEAAGVSKRTGFKWLARFKAEGAAGPADRSSRPKRSPRALTAQKQAQLEDLRRRRWPLWRIAEQAGCGVATVSRCMKRLGLSRLKSLEPPQPVVRYERAAAGELLHLDTKKLMHIDGIGHRITGDRRTTKRGIEPYRESRRPVGLSQTAVV